MTPTEMETLLQNLDARWARIEQILPTLATREDLARVERGLRTELTEQIAASAQAVRADLTEQINTSANRLRVLIEASRDETRVVAEHLLDLMSRFPRSP